jgi:chaperone modulatory protein CbpM
MIQISAVMALFNDLAEPELVAWIERGWVRPETADAGWVFEDIDVARVRLIYDLRHGMSVQEDTIPLVLSLLDQLYELRSHLRTVLKVVEAQPEPIRGPILAALGG